MSVNNGFYIREQLLLAVFSCDYGLILRVEITRVEHFDLLHYFQCFMDNRLIYKQVYIYIYSLVHL